MTQWYVMYGNDRKAMHTLQFYKQDQCFPERFPSQTHDKSKYVVINTNSLKLVKNLRLNYSYVVIDTKSLVMAKIYSHNSMIDTDMSNLVTGYGFNFYQIFTDKDNRVGVIKLMLEG